MGQQRFLFILGVALCFILAVLFYRSAHEGAMGISDTNSDLRPRLVLIPAGADEDAFWQEAIAGAETAAADEGAVLYVFKHDGSVEGQTRQLVRVRPEEFDGVALSPLAPSSQTQTISRLATEIKVVTLDSDAPNSLRHLYVGTNNFTAGRQAANLVKQSLPDGGQIAIFIGDNERQNARDRRHSLISELAERSLDEVVDDEQLDVVGDPIDAGNYTIVATYLDDHEPEQATANAGQALKDYPQLAGMVALYGYNGPACLAALREANKLKAVKLITFDTFDETLAGVADGSVVATIVQDPFLYGYESIGMLCRLCRTRRVALPLPGAGTIALETRVVNADNLDEYLKSRGRRTETADE